MDTPAPKNPSSLAPRGLTRKPRLPLNRFAVKPPNPTSPKDVEEAKKPKVSSETSKPATSLVQAPPSAFARNGPPLSVLEPELKRKGSRLGSLGNLVRRASRNLRDVTNINDATNPKELAKFVDVGVEDVRVVDEGVSVEVHTQTSEHVCVKPRTETEKAALEGRDPDIGEIMVVRRSRPRTALDLEWAQSQQEEATTTDGERRNGRSKTSWWSNNKGKKADEGSKQEGERILIHLESLDRPFYSLVISDCYVTRCP